MREIRPSGSEWGAGRKPRSYLYQCISFASAVTDRRHNASQMSCNSNIARIL